ncbi:MAG: ATP-dependent Clp protease adaptor ClpS [Fimbriimonadaceae bacterium]|nr:ATP-dependent Clp protease adaptor ClpS [Fimbriimonadaceae bacterium]
MERLTNLGALTVSHTAVVEPPIWENSSPVAEPELISSQSDKTGGGWLVTVFNNETNTYLEVVAILMIATGCDAEEAYIETWEIDHYGQCSVHRASQSECEKAAEIIATIGIHVEAEPDPLA